MNLEEEFDDIFKRKAEEAKFSFKEADWEKARKMIDKERIANFNSTSRTNYWYVSAIVLISSVAILYFSFPESTQIAQLDEVVFQPDEKSNSELKTESLKTENIEFNFHKEKKAGMTERVAEENTEKNAIDILANTTHEPIDSKLSDPNAILTSENSPELINNVAEPNSSIVSTKSEPVQSIEETAELNKYETNLSFLRKESRLPITKSDVAVQLKPVFLKRYEDDYVKKPKPKFIRSYLSADLGLSLLTGWESNGVVNARGLNGYVGFNYGHFLTKKMSFSLGAELYNISHMNHEFYTNTSVDYGFGSVQTQTTLACQSMLFLSIPLRVYYYVDQHHLLGFGIHAGSLLMSSNTVETSKLLDGLKQSTKTISNKGVYEGMNTRNIVLSASLSKTIAEKISLKFEMFYGISDLFSDTPTNGQTQNSNGIRIGMNYRIFRN